ncbi:hypothetical protein HDV06_000609 [Boothiomyces sp. JEL0866]|nr:hypothetical protein HDV06_000609 [Boothiomyces sp. JEL0866]
MNILIVGAGAVGCTFGSHFHHSGAKVSLVCRSNYEAIKTNGIKFETFNWGNYHFTPDNVFKSTNQVTGKYDHVVVTTKAIPQINLVELLKPVIAENTMIHLIQNGIGIEDELAAQYPNNPIVSCIAYIACHQKEPGYIVATSHVTYFTLGLFKLNSLDDKKLQQFIDHGRAGKLTLNKDDCIQRSRWKKLIWNASFNPLCIVSGNKTCKEILDDEDLHSLIRSLMTEVVVTANKLFEEKIPLEAVDENITNTLKIGHYKPSMLLDWEHGNPIEIDAILRNPILVAEKNGMEMHNLKVIYRLLKAKLREIKN